jgi:uncharacterized protein (UPF0335 family)
MGFGRIAKSIILLVKLEHTETFLERIEELEQEWTNIELQTASIIEHWEQYGFDLDIWRYKATEEPRSALAELTYIHSSG